MRQSDGATTALVVGLGNPGDEYAATRHNVGFEVLDALARRLGERPFLLRGRSLVARAAVDGPAGQRACLLAKPQTFMNNSGREVRDLLTEAEGPLELLVVCDDFHLPLGRLRCRRSGSAGGQNGLASILEHVASLDDRQVPRLRVGIGDPGRVPAEQYVLRPFKRAERPAVDAVVDRAAGHLHDWLGHGDLDRLIEACNAPDPQA